MTNTTNNSAAVALTESDIPRSSLEGRKPAKRNSRDLYLVSIGWFGHQSLVGRPPIRLWCIMSILVLSKACVHSIPFLRTYTSVAVRTAWNVGLPPPSPSPSLGARYPSGNASRLQLLASRQQPTDLHGDMSHHIQNVNLIQLGS